MSEKNWIPDSFEFPEILEERESYVDRCSHIKEVAIFPNDLVILPFEWMPLKVSDPAAKQMLDEAEKDEIYLGVGLQEKGEKALPAVGSIGVGADIAEIDKKSVRGTYLVTLRGVIRFIIDEYVETDRPYPVARITFFEDNRKMNKWEREMYPKFADELRALMTQFNKQFGKYRHLDNLADTIENRQLEAHSFFLWFLFAPVPQEIRQTLLEARSTVQRTYLLNRQIERAMGRLKKTTPASFN